MREGSDNWSNMAEDMRLDEKVLGKTSAKGKTGTETWWLCDEVQQCIQSKKTAQGEVLQISSITTVTNE